MARIAGINLPDRKHIWVALTSIYGVGKTRAIKICADAGVDQAKKVKDLEEKDLEILRNFVAKYQQFYRIRLKSSVCHSTHKGRW